MGSYNSTPRQAGSHKPRRVAVTGTGKRVGDLGIQGASRSRRDIDTLYPGTSVPARYRRPLTICTEPSSIYNNQTSIFRAVSKQTPNLGGIEELLDEGQRLCSVLVDVLLVRVGIVAVAAVRVGRVAVRLNDGRLGRRALEALGTGGELFIASSVRVRLWSR